MMAQTKEERLTHPPPGLFDAADPDVEAARSSCRAFVAAKESKPPKRKTIPPAAMARATAEMEEMKRTGDWSTALPRHFVAAFEAQHVLVYGVADAEMNGATRMMAAGAAHRMLQHEFGGDQDAMALYMRWAWIREEGREKWRRENGRDGGRVGWRLMFGGALLTDYRLDQQRRR